MQKQLSAFIMTGSALCAKQKLQKELMDFIEKTIQYDSAKGAGLNATKNSFEFSVIINRFFLKVTLKFERAIALCTQESPLCAQKN